VARARYLAAGYADVVAERAVFEDALNRLPTFPGRKRIDAWLALADVGALDQLAGELMELHYDPAYERSQRKDPHPRIGEVALAGLGPDELDRAACEVAAIVNGLG
jgi:tRNA 2-selenouridine synthase